LRARTERAHLLSNHPSKEFSGELKWWILKTRKNFLLHWGIYKRGVSCKKRFLLEGLKELSVKPFTNHALVLTSHRQENAGENGVGKEH